MTDFIRQPLSNTTEKVEAHVQDIAEKKRRLTELNNLSPVIERRLLKLDKAIKAVSDALNALHVTEDQDAAFTDAVAAHIEVQWQQLQGHRDNLQEEFGRIYDEAAAIEKIPGVLCDCHGSMECPTIDREPARIGSIELLPQWSMKAPAFLVTFIGKTGQQTLEGTQQRLVAHAEGFWRNNGLDSSDGRDAVNRACAVLIETASWRQK
jgi:hypothetical protein